MSHGGNATVESGFSVNGDLLVETMNEVSIVAQRVVYDELRAKGFDISSAEHRTSCSQYLDMKKQTASEEQKRKTEKRKTEAQIKSLETQKETENGRTLLSNTTA